MLAGKLFVDFMISFLMVGGGGGVLLSSGIVLVGLSGFLGLCGVDGFTIFDSGVLDRAFTVDVLAVSFSSMSVISFGSLSRIRGSRAIFELTMIFDFGSCNESVRKKLCQRN